MRRLNVVSWLLAGHLLAAATVTPALADRVADHARRLHFSSIVLVTHADTTQYFGRADYDFMRRNHDGSQVDLPRMREGGLNAIFFSIWIDPKIMGPPAVGKALDQIDSVRQLVHDHPADLELATSAAEVLRAHEHHKVAVLMGVEGGHMLGNDLRMVRIYADLGVRYMTLTHQLNNEWADSSTDKPAHNGLTDFGKDVVREMNRQGMLVDISHVSDKTFYDALEVSRAPLIASHSSVRAISHIPRNMGDDMIRALAAKGGVILINFAMSSLSDEFRQAYQGEADERVAYIKKLAAACHDDDPCMEARAHQDIVEAQAAGRLPRVSWEPIVDQIDYVVRLVGVDHVGLGSDFDGAQMPDGMEDCSHLPRITEALVRRGYSDADIRKILGGNLLRVLETAQRVAHELGGR